MKTLNNLKIYFPAFTLLLVLTLSVNAQGNGKSSHDKNEKKWENSKVYKKEKEAQEDNHRTVYQPSYSKKWYHKAPDYYVHRDYGRVYRRFDEKPLVIKYNQGNFYYYGNHFYTYRKGIGYCVVDAPRHIYFSSLPSQTVKVHINGNLIFRNGNLFFQLSPRGYSLVPAPVEVNVSAKF